ncbi:MlaD family protein [Paraburkholderia oxyphila]|uniref:MlaD family protein n=1 Tax=Paraburkholderia oxyphila TaxID=614212 RepID=UPI00048A3487|nr:MlaD family protein [Paraburkholderia oxyphila]
METRAHHVLIGLFTVAVVAAAMLFGLWLAKGPTSGGFTEYDIIFHEPVYGLSEGSPVQYSGVNVGDVLTLSLDPADPRQVHARVRIGRKTPVKRDTEARLAMTGITGTSVIQLSGGTPQSPRLAAPAGETPVIVASRSALSTFAEGGEDVVSNLNATLRAMQQVLSPENATRIGQTLADVQQVAGALANERGDLHAMLLAITASAHDADHALKSADRLMQQGNALASGQGPQIVANVQQLTASLARTSDSVDQLVQANRAAIKSGLRGADQLGPTLAELRATLASLRELTERLQEDPSGWLLGRDKLPEFSP